MTVWRECALGEVVNLKRGYDLPNSSRIPGPFPVVSSSGITDHHVEAKVVAPGVVTGRYGTLGQVFFIKKDFWPLNTSLYVQDFKGNDPKFISYFLRSLNLGSQNAAAAVPGVNRNHLHAMPVRIPTPPFQKRIASILSAYDELIENSQQRIKILEAMARALYCEWFVHFRYPGHESVPLVSSTLGDMPHGWEVKKIAEFADFTRGFEPGTDAYKKEPGIGLIKFLRVGDLSKRDSGLFIDEQLVQGRVLKPLDIAITLDGSVGMVRIGLDGAYSSGIRRVDVKDPSRLGWVFTYQLLLSDTSQATIHAHARGTTIMHAGSAVAALDFISPPTTLIAKFESIAAPMMQKVLILHAHVENLRRTRDLLLPRLLSGQIDVETIAA